MQETLFYIVQNLKYFEEATTHKSFGNGKSYEKLECLGDSVLKLIQTDEVYHICDNEKQMTQKRNLIENNKYLAEWCDNIGLNKCIKIATHIEVTTRMKAGVFEAIFGALWLSCDTPHLAIYEWYENIKPYKPDINDINYKGYAQEYMAKRHLAIPEYSTYVESNIFICKMSVNNDIFFGVGKSIKSSEIEAAKKFYISVN